MSSVTRRKSARRPSVTVVPDRPAPVRPAPRPSWLQSGCLLITLLILAVAIATLAFWYYVASSGVLDLTDTALYFMRNVGLIGLLIGGGGLFFAFGAFRRAVLPAAGLLEALDQAANGEYEIEVQETGPREVRVLQRSVNRLLEQLRARELTRHELTAGVASALLAARPDEPRHMLIVQDWHRLSMADKGELQLHPEPTDLGALTRDTLMALHPEASARGVILHATIPTAPLIAELDPVCFGDILRALVLHAIGRMNPGGEILVDLSESHHPNGVRVGVMDNGHAPAKAELAGLLTDFQAGAQVGSGLELPLARTLVGAQRGEISAYAEGSAGLTVAFLLPFA